MSDQVKIVAAEDAPSNTEGGETLASAQTTSEQPEATTAESSIAIAPAAEALAENAPAAEETHEEPLVDGPVGEVLDHANEDTETTPDPVEEEVETSVVDAPVAQEVQESQEEPLVDGPVGEVLDHHNETPEEMQDESMESTETASSEGAKSNVRILSVGQQVTGNVKRIADFGAFVDIGVGRDGLIHISELSVRRVGKVTDVLSEGQEVTAWIKKLDRDRNRISLTLIDPNTKTIRDLNKDDIVQGTVTRILPYGAFVDIGIGRDALLHVREMGVGYVAKPEDVVKVGDTIEARIIELSRRRGRVDLSLKGLREEPEPTPPPQMATPPQPQAQEPQRSRHQPEPEEEEEDDLEDLEVLSPMELAFKRAMEAEGMELNINRKKQNKRNRRERNRSLQDEIITRTLSSGRK